MALQEQKIKKLTEREHILARSGMYLGSSTLTKMKEFVLTDDKFVYSDIEYVPGLVKIFNELIDNSIDEHVRTKGEFADKIDITMTDKVFSVRDNGRGIPVKESTDEHGNILYTPELAWTHARAGSNFEDEKSTTIGTNGVGSMIASVFSKEFIGISNDSNLKCTVKCIDNNNEIKTSVSKPTGKQGTYVEIVPDVEKFGLDKITDNHIKMIEQRLYNLSVAYPFCTFRFNNKRIKLKAKNYLEMFNTNNESKGTIVINDKFSIGVFHSNEDEFKHFTLMNGLSLTAGGTQIDYIANGLSYRVKDKIARKYKEIKPGDVKQKLFIVVIMTDFEGPKYETQTKEKLTNPTKEISSYFNELSLDNLADKVYRNKSITDSIIDYFRIKEEHKKKQELKGLNKTIKKIKSEKYTKSVGTNDILVICEGQCLEENTELLTTDLTPKKIKDFNQGDLIVSGDSSVQEIVSITKNLRELVYIKSKSGIIKCSKKHRWYVYIKDIKKFDYVEAGEIVKDRTNYALVKSKINSETQFLKVNSNENKVITTDNGIIEYTDEDFFLIQSNGSVLRKKGNDIVQNEYLILNHR